MVKSKSTLITSIIFSSLSLLGLLLSLILLGFFIYNLQITPECGPYVCVKIEGEGIIFIFYLLSLIPLSIINILAIIFTALAKKFYFKLKKLLICDILMFVIEVIILLVMFLLLY